MKYVKFLAFRWNSSLSTKPKNKRSGTVVVTVPSAYYA